MQIIQTILVFLFSISSLSAAQSSSEYQDFLTYAYCDVAGVQAGSSSSGQQRVWFENRLDDLLSGRVSAQEILTDLRRVRQWQALSPLGATCRSEEAKADRLGGYQRYVDDSYRRFFGVRKDPKDKSSTQKVVDLALKKSSESDLEKQMQDLAICHNKDPGAYPVSGERVGDPEVLPVGECIIPKDSEIAKSEGEPAHELSNKDIYFYWTRLAVEGGALVIYERSYKSPEYTRRNFTITSPSVAGCEKERHFRLEAKYHSLFEQEVLNCQKQALAADKTCFEEALLARSDIIQYCPMSVGSDEYSKTYYTCREEYILKANSRLQQKGCKRRVDDCVHCSMNQDLYLTDHSLKEVLFTSKNWIINDESDKKRFYSDEWDDVDYKFLKCVHDASTNLHRQYNFEQTILAQEDYKKCGLLTNKHHSCWKDERTGGEFCTTTSKNETRFLSEQVNSQLPSNIVRNALTNGVFDGFFYVNQSEPLTIDGKKYWGFYLYYTLDTSAKMVNANLWSGNYSKGRDWELDENGLVKFGVDGSPITVEESKSMLSKSSSLPDSCIDYVFGRFLDSLRVEKANFQKVIEDELNAIGCSNRVEALCDQSELLKLRVPERLAEKDKELHEKLINELKLNPMCINSEQAKKQLNSTVEDLMKQLDN